MHTCPSNATIHLEQVTRTYAGGHSPIRAVDRLTWNSAQRGFWVVAGSSGSGKTTLLQIIGGIERPSSGEVWVEWRPLHQLNETQLADFRRHRIGFIFQGNNLLRHLTVYENVELPLLLTQGHGQAARIRHQLDLVGLADRAEAYPADLSGGEQQRVAVARALIHRPCLVLADEPTANLDSSAGLALFDLLRALPGELGITVLVATHDPLLIDRAPALLHLVDGRPGTAEARKR
ncbi:MAG: ABC transporter ATP-binding protein [Desulfosarcinaceae bacterium]|nr:ABC transporter ATP-binding protein [Desulfosarcinaceae bacterium]